MFTNSNAKYIIEVSIRSDLTGNDLTKVTRYMKGEGDEGWIDFDFRDINVTPGKTYYIVCKTWDSSTSRSYCYSWFYAWHKEGKEGPYSRGEVYISHDYGDSWNAIPDDDFCFITYGK